MTESLHQVTLNGIKVVALPCFLKGLVAAHKEIAASGIGINGKLGFVPSNDMNGSWRSLSMQKLLVARGASRTLYSNHRRGTAVDCYADWDYIKRIQPIMESHGLTNDLAYIDTDAHGNIIRHDSNPFDGSYVDADEFKAWDGGHWNYRSNTEAAKFPVIDSMPSYIPDFIEDMYEGEIIQCSEGGYPGVSGVFAFVDKGKKRIIRDESRGWKVLATLDIRKNGNGLTKLQWDAIPTGEDF